MALGPVDPTFVFAGIFAAIGKQLAKVAGKGWERVQWPQAANEYASKVKRLYGTTRILGKPDPVPLGGKEGIYTDVHVFDQPTALRRFTVEQLEAQYSTRETRHRFDERHDGLTVMEKTGKLFILGKPGAGKTTFCKYIALQAAEGGIEKVPIFISLKELADSGNSVLDFVVSQFDICNFPDALPFVERLLKAGKAIVLLDGLDEVQQADDKQMVLTTAIKNFVNKYDTNHYLITCRIAATDYTFEPFTYVEMADFTEAQVQTFVGKWFTDDDEKRRTFLAEFQKPEHKGLQELAQTPLLLTLLCLTFEETLYFPPRRVEIYEEALDALLKKWDSSRNIRRDEIYRKLSLGRKWQMFARIAHARFDEGQYFIPEKVLAQQIEDYLCRVPSTDANEDIDGIAVLKAMEAQHGIFVERARNIYSFAHLTFQEYFTARYIVDNAAQGTLDLLVYHHLTDARWREVFLLVTSMLDDADTFFDSIFAKVDALVRAFGPLAAFLTWVNRRANVVQASGYRPLIVRSSYLALVLTIFFHRAHIDVLVQARELIYNLVSASIEAPVFVRDLVLDRVFSENLDYPHALTFAHNRVNNLEHPLTRAVAQDIASALDAEIFDLLRQFDFGILAEYLSATHLILDCARLAYVSDRVAIENRLLLPPQQPPA